jgi:hypothetical protein
MAQTNEAPKVTLDDHFNVGTKAEQLQKRVEYINKFGFVAWNAVIANSRPQK